MKRDDVPPGFGAYYDAAKHAGCSDADIRAAIADMIRVDAALDVLECPECGADVARDLDPNQGGATQARGVWVRYRCNACSHFCTRIEPASAAVCQ